jgi:hypothetical protein
MHLETAGPTKEGSLADFRCQVAGPLKKDMP